MISRRNFLTGSGLALAGTAVMGSANANAGAQTATLGDGHITVATAITQVFGTGQKLIAVALRYDKVIDNSSLSKDTFQATDRTVTRVYSNTAAGVIEKGRGVDGRWVIIELSLDDAAASLWVLQMGGGPPPSGGGGTGGPPTGGPPPVILPAIATVTQVAAIRTADGRTLKPSATAVTTTKSDNLLVDAFDQFTFDDPVTGESLPYNLFVPDDYDPSKQYPLVLFMHDASVVGAPVLGPLVQGLGAVCWTRPEDQRKHPCLVVAPQYPVVVVEDDYLPDAYFDTTAHLVEKLTETYSIDAKRRYTTGQSMGAMMSLGLDIKYPDLFGGSFIVAGQWPAAQTAPLAGKKMWILVSQGDAKAYPFGTAMVSYLEGLGADIYVDDPMVRGDATVAELNAAARAVEAHHAPINFTTFVIDTLPGVTATNPGSEHESTWPVAYRIPVIRDWLFKQTL